MKYIIEAGGNIYGSLFVNFENYNIDGRKFYTIRNENV